MKKRFLVLALALCLVFALGLAHAEDDTTETPVIDHATCGVEGTDWEAVMDEEDYIPATCEEDGMLRKHCNNCGVYVEEIVLPKLGGHKVEVDPAKAATCTETGLTEGKSCHNEIELADGTKVKCDYVEVAQEETDALGHGEPEPVDPDWRPENYDCEAGFSTPARCSVCKEELKEEIHVTFEHKPEVLEAVEATCAAIGWTEGSKCSVCGKILVAQEEIEKLPHTLVFVPATAGSCTEAAVTYHQACTKCDYKDSDYQVLPAPGHKEKVIPAVAPTCTEKGLTAGVMCSVCGKVLIPQFEIRALGHKWETVLGVAATCEETGIAAHRSCTRCGVVEFNGSEFEGEKAQEAVIIPAHGHVDEDGYENKPAVGKPALPRKADPTLLVKTTPDDEKPATCTEDGYVSALHCPWCEEERVAEKILPATGHDWQIIKTGVVPGCTTTGISDQWECQNCFEKKGNEVIKPLGHDMVTVPAVLATCYTAGNYEYAYCTRVGCLHAEITELDVGIMASITTITLVKDADNKVVAHPVEVVIPAFNHGYAAGVTEYKPGISSVVSDIAPVAPTCYSTGLAAGGLYCELCEKVIVPAAVLDMVPHLFATNIGYDATCTTYGLKYYRFCLNGKCGLVQIYDPATGETIEECYYTLNEQNQIQFPECIWIPAFGHDPKPGTGKAPTCTEAGWTDGLYCGTCGITLEKQEPIEALGHTSDIILEAKAPTCTETGLTEGKQCSVCEAITVPQQVIPATGHIYDQYTPAIAATCYSVGHTEGLRCSVCEPDYGSNEGWLIFPQEIPMKPHRGFQIPAKAPTCTETGNLEFWYCLNEGCTAGNIIDENGEMGDELVVDNKLAGYPAEVIIPALGHDFLKFDEQKPTCTEYGVISARTCKRCGITLPQEKVDPLGHNIVEIPAVPATCTEDGTTAGAKCDRCGLITIAPAVAPATGHNMVHVDAKEPTCVEDGNKEGQKCANEGCDHKIGCEVIEKLEHTPSGKWVVEIAPTYGPDGQGLEVMYCTVCGHKIDARMIPALSGGLLGDANDDGAVNVIDVLVILQYDAQIISNINETLADYNQDGDVNVLDAMALLYAV